MILLFQIGYGALAQADYVVTLKSDTIIGDIRILSYDKLDRAQVSVKGKKELFTAVQVLILKKDNEFYKSIQIDNTIRFMKILKSGYLSYYAFRLPEKATYDGRYMVKMDGNNMELPNIGFKRIMAAYLEDCKELSEKVKNGEIGRTKIEEIIDQYNACVASPTPAVTVLEATPESTTVILQKVAIQNLKNKINEQDFNSKQDALDILGDIESKVNRNENVSNYLLDGLQSALKDQPALSEDLNKLIALLKK